MATTRKTSKFDRFGNEIKKNRQTDMGRYEGNIVIGETSLTQL